MFLHNPQLLCVAVPNTTATFSPCLSARHCHHCTDLVRHPEGLCQRGLPGAGHHRCDAFPPRLWLCFQVFFGVFLGGGGGGMFKLVTHISTRPRADACEVNMQSCICHVPNPILSGVFPDLHFSFVFLQNFAFSKFPPAACRCPAGALRRFSVFAHKKELLFFFREPGSPLWLHFCVLRSLRCRPSPPDPIGGRDRGLGPPQKPPPAAGLPCPPPQAVHVLRGLQPVRHPRWRSPRSSGDEGAQAGPESSFIPTSPSPGSLTGSVGVNPPPPKVGLLGST